MKSLVICSSLSALAGCTAVSFYSSAPAPGHPLALLDESAQVEVVQGEDPRKYYIANRPALNAVDADNDGIWDDVQARLLSAPVIARVDPRVVRQVVRSYQDNLLTKTRAEAKANPSSYSYAMACHYYLSKTKGVSESQARQDFRELARAVEAALFVSKERVLAGEYADAMASGGRFDSAPEAQGSCR